MIPQTPSASPEASSAAGIQQAALAMQEESGDHCSELTRKIARAGTWGRHANNVGRDICRALGLPLESELNQALFIFVEKEQAN